MLRKNNGITLTALVITVIVVLIIAGITVTTSDELLKDTKSRAITTNMYIIKGKIETIYDDYAFSESNNIFKGTKVKVSSLSSYGVTSSGDSDNYWYKIAKSNLKDLGMEESMLSGGASFIVNYQTGEVIYSAGVKDSSGIVKYKLSEMEN